MEADILYGKDALTVHFPDEIDVTLVHKQPMTQLDNPELKLREAFQSPSSCRPLKQLAKTRKKACILICDITRPVPHKVLLPPLIEELVDGGIPKENILLLIATGLHRPNEGDELREVIGSETVLRSVPIANHFARDRHAHADLGRTASGIPILIDRRFTEADLRITVGLVEPHFMAGYSGGRKLVAPGVPHCDTIFRLHAGGIMDHPQAANCIIDDNPLHREQLEIIDRVGEIFALNVVIDDHRRISFVNFGEVKASHAEAVAFMRRYAEVSLPRRFKTVVTSAAGYPLDKTFYQSIKGMVGVLDILEPGGTIIIASECSEGMGSPEFVAAQGNLCQLGPGRFMAEVLERNLAHIDEWQTQMLVKALRVGSIRLFTTGLKPCELAHTYVTPVASVVQATLESVKTHQDPHIAVVPEGPYVIPVHRG